MEYNTTQDNTLRNNVSHKMGSKLAPMQNKKDSHKSSRRQEVYTRTFWSGRTSGEVWVDWFRVLEKLFLRLLYNPIQ